MSTRFEFATAAHILFGNGVLKEAGLLAAGLGRSALVVAGQRASVKENSADTQRNPDLERLIGLLEASQVRAEVFAVRGEPTVDTVQAGVQAARAAGCDLLIGFGGGSAIDAAKAIAAMLTNPGELLDYLEVVGKYRPILERPAPFLAIPTTAGTGSEVTRNAVIGVPEKQVKVSLRSPLLLARAALVDPELTYSLPPAVTASTGMDALAQVIEPYVSRRANPLTDVYCREGILRASRSLLRAYQNGADPAPREDMAFASLMGGLALANAGLGAVHGFAGPIGGMFDASHGAVCAALLPGVVQINARSLAEREPGNPALTRYREIAQWMTGSSAAGIPELVIWLEELREALMIPTLSEFGVRPQDLDELVQKSAVASSMKANPILLTPGELREILEKAL